MQAPDEPMTPANGSSLAATLPASEHGTDRGADYGAAVALNGDAHGLAELLHALQAMRIGDFTVRMAGDRVGIMGKIADTFNEIVATNQRMASQLERVGPGGRPRRPDPPARSHRTLGWRLGRDGVLG